MNGLIDNIQYFIKKSSKNIYLNEIENDINEINYVILTLTSVLYLVLL